MGRRSGAGGKPIKARRRKAATQSRPSAPKAGGRRKPSSTGANTKLALLKRERDEALEQARTETQTKVLAARLALEQSAAAGREQIESMSGELSAQVLKAVLPAGVAGTGAAQ